jgi:hypothetical protein
MLIACVGGAFCISEFYEKSWDFRHNTPMVLYAALLVSVGAGTVDCMVRSFMDKTIQHLDFSFVGFIDDGVSMYLFCMSCRVLALLAIFLPALVVKRSSIQEGAEVEFAGLLGHLPTTTNNPSGAEGGRGLVTPLFGAFFSVFSAMIVGLELLVRDQVRYQTTQSLNLPSSFTHFCEIIIIMYSLFPHSYTTYTTHTPLTPPLIGLGRL